MKYIRKIYELENNQFKFSDIINILNDLIDDDIPLSIISATGIVYKPEDISRKGIDDIFKLNRWVLIPNQSFSIRIDDSMNYSKLCEVMVRMKAIIGRFEDLGFKLISFNMENLDTDEFSTSDLEYRFQYDNI
jgi:hypothetical protein